MQELEKRLLVGSAAVAAVAVTCGVLEESSANQRDSFDSMLGSTDHGITDPRTNIEDLGIFLSESGIQVSVHQNRAISQNNLEAVAIVLGWSNSGSPLTISEQSPGNYNVVPAVEFVQRLVNVTADGKFGPKTASAISEVLERVNQGLADDEKFDLGKPLTLGQREIIALIRACPKITPHSLEEFVAIGIAQPDKAEPIPANSQYNPITVDIQRRLVEDGKSVGPQGVDGKLGGNTSLALNAFEQERGLPVSQDGSITHNTALAIYLTNCITFADLHEKIAHSSWYNDMNQGWQDSIINEMQCLDPTALSFLSQLTDHQTFHLFDTNQKCKLLTVFLKCGSDGRSSLNNLLSRQVGETPALLHRCPGLDEEGKPVLVVDKLYDLSSDPLLPELECLRSELLAAVIQELSNPFEVNQGPYGRCGGDVIYFYAQLGEPGIAAALAVEPLDDGFMVTIGGTTLRYVPTSETCEGGITPIESMVDSMLLNEGVRAEDPSLRYDPHADKHVRVDTNQADSGGMSLTAIRDQMASLFGRPFVLKTVNGGVPETRLANELRNAPIGTVVSVRWRDLTQTEIENLSAGERGARHSFHVVNFLGYEPPTINLETGRMDEGKFYVRTWGRRTDTLEGVDLADAGLNEIDHVLFDKENGIYIIPERAMYDHIRGLVIDSAPPAHLR